MPIIHPAVTSLQELAEMLAWPATEGPINRIQIERSATGGGAGYANIGSVTLVANTLPYTFYDVAGVATDWYRWYPSNAANTFPTSVNRNYTSEIQPSDPGAGLLCDLGDVKQELGILAATTTDDELILQKISEVSTAIMGETGRLFARSPSSGTTTLLFDVATSGRTLRVPKGIATATTLQVATSSQPESAGTYTTVTAAEWFLRPNAQDRDYGWPATSIVISDVSGSYFTAGYNTVKLTGALGWATVPADIRAIAIRASVANYMAKGSGAGGVAAAGPNGATWILRSISPADAERLAWYGVKVVG